MATRRFLFENPPFRYLVFHLAQDDDFQNDGRLILSLPDEDYSRLTSQLASDENFLNLSRLTSIVENSLGEREGGADIANIIYRVGEVIHNAELDSTSAMDRLAEAISEKAESLQPKERTGLSNRLRKLAVEPEGIAKHFKARQLVDSLGSELNDFRIICDIRPIFDPQRERVDGAIPLTILRLEYTEQDGDTNVIELRLTEKQLVRIEESIHDAKGKLDMIKSLLSSQDISIPATKATVAQ